MLTGDRIDNIQGLKGIGPVKAARLLKGLTGDKEMYEAVVEAYKAAKEPVERVLENGCLLWLRREKGQTWQPPA